MFFVFIYKRNQYFPKKLEICVGNSHLPSLHFTELIERGVRVCISVPLASERLGYHHRLHLEHTCLSWLIYGGGR